MNSKQRLVISNSHIRFTNEVEKVFVKRVKRILGLLVKEFISSLKTYGVAYAVNLFNTKIYDERLTPILTDLIKEVAINRAVWQYRRLRKYVNQANKQKQEFQESAAFGFNDIWNEQILDFLRQYLLRKAVLPITESSRKQIFEVIREGQVNGWGIDRMVTELEGLSDVNEVRARRIVRTETAIAVNFANKMVKDSIPFEVLKEWITAKDHRVRDSHRKMDGEIIDEDMDFHVPRIKKGVQIGIDLMTGPGDPEAHADNVINCRCALAFTPKRDDKGKLIKKQQKIKP